MSERKHPLIKYLTITGGVFVASFIATGSALYEFALSRKGLNSRIVGKIIKENSERHPLSEFRQGLEKQIDDGALWFGNETKVDLSVMNMERKQLHAQLIRPENESNIYVLCIHGYNSCPRKMGIYAKKFKELGYNVILPSLRGHADSEDDFVTMGWKDRLDVIDWVEEIVKYEPECKIILHGVSMGAATTMMVTGEELPTNVRLAIEDCGYTTVWDILSYKMKYSMKLPSFPFLYSADKINKYKEDFSFKEASCLEQVKKSVTPTLFIHGEEDDFVPYGMLDKVYSAAQCEKEKLSIPNAPHARSVCVAPDIYWKTITDFIKKYL